MNDHVKKALIYSLLFFYLLVQLRPLTAVLQDIVAHTFYRMQHMATVHYENGHYHLHAELKDINESEKDSSQNLPQQKSNESISNQLLPQFELNLIQVCKELGFLLVSSQKTSSPFRQINAPPPRS
jgi:hypothetical protein